MPCGITGKEVEKEKARTKAKRAKEEKETYNAIVVDISVTELPSAEWTYDLCHTCREALVARQDPKEKIMHSECQAQQLIKVTKERAKERMIDQSNGILMSSKVVA